ncbi:hypothetical protein [Lysobacter sp. Root690]|uniref:hypothetical protein n=1 Tax=Lysobacter sp. Root690 TaxID=1736588 RepID=UPI0012F78CFD|nr:hypothetical protein [Lysobacter sp. Root690]
MPDPDRNQANVCSLALDDAAPAHALSHPHSATVAIIIIVATSEADTAQSIRSRIDAELANDLSFIDRRPAQSEARVAAG